MSLFGVLWIVLTALFTWAAVALWIAAARCGSRTLGLHGAVAAVFAISLVVRLLAGDTPAGDILFAVLLAGATLYDLQLTIRFPVYEELARHGMTRRSLLLFQRPRPRGEDA